MEDSPKAKRLGLLMLAAPYSKEALLLPATALAFGSAFCFLAGWLVCPKG